MKKLCRMVLMGLVLSVALSAPAMAATGIEADGKTYVVYGDRSTFEADGKTFVISADSVRIQEAGKPDRVLKLGHSQDGEGTLVEDVATSGADTTSDGTASEAVLIAETCEAAAISSGISSEAADCSSGMSPVLYDTPASKSARFGQYARFGLSYDAAENVLYYQGRRVRVFEDSYSLEDNTFNIIEHFDELGAIDVDAQRDLTIRDRSADGSYDPSGQLTGLRALTGAEFTARDLTQWTHPRAAVTYAVAESGTPMTPEEAQAFYAPYAAFGLTYDAKTDRLFYDGQVVRAFLDIRKTNGESLSGGRFKGEMTMTTNEFGTIGVTTIRDYANPDAQGNGKLIGMSVEKAK